MTAATTSMRIEGHLFEPRSPMSKRFKLAVWASIAFHIFLFATSPYWQPASERKEEVIEVGFTEVPEEALPEIPQVKVAAPEAVPPPPPKESIPLPADSSPPPQPTREEIREKVQTQGLLKVMHQADPLPKINMPTLSASKSRPAAGGDYAPRPAVDPDAPKSAPTIQGQVAQASRASTALSSQVFRTDSGLEASVQGAIADEGRSAQSIISVVKQYQSGIRYAYNKELLANPNIAGRIVVGFTVTADGGVEGIEIRESTVKWPQLEEAVRKKISFWKFPKSKSGSVKVVFPFVFQPET